MTILRLRAVHLSFAGLFAVAVLHAESTATIKADRTNLRAKPAFDGEVLATLQKGDTVTVLGQVPGTGTDGKPRDWTKVALPKRAQVWVYAPLVDEKTKVVKGKSLNLRAGPGTRYPIEWVYRRVGLPVQIEREFEAWRLVTDQDGVKGWVHSATLQGRRGFAVRGRERALRKSAADDAAPVALLKPGVVGRIRACEANAIWCEVQVSDYRGWLKRDEIWGVFATEAVK